MCYYFWPTPLVNCWVTQIRTVNITKGFMNLKNLSNYLEKPLSSSSSSFRVKQHKFTITQCVILSNVDSQFLLTTPATLQMFTNIAAYCKHFFTLIFSHRRPSAPITCSCPGVALEGLFFPFVELGTACLDWVGPGWVVEGNRQLEMGAHVECEELGCVVGGPFKPNKLREVRGLVWRPWINKPSEMTMRCADICHHTSLASKHKPPKPSLLLSPFHVLCPTWCLSQLPLSLSSLLFCLPCLYLTYQNQIFSPLHLAFSLPSPALPPSLPPPPPISIPPFHLSPETPSIEPFIHAWLAVRPGFCMCYRQRYGTALALSRLTTAETLGVQAHAVYFLKGSCRLFSHKE